MIVAAVRFPVRSVLIVVILYGAMAGRALAEAKSNKPVAKVPAGQGVEPVQEKCIVSGYIEWSTSHHRPFICSGFTVTLTASDGTVLSSAKATTTKGRDGSCYYKMPPVPRIALRINATYFGFVGFNSKYKLVITELGGKPLPDDFQWPTLQNYCPVPSSVYNFKATLVPVGP